MICFESVAIAPTSVVYTMLKDKNANVFGCLFMYLVYQMTKLMFPQYSEWAETWSSLRPFSVCKISLRDSISRSERWGEFSPHASAPRHLTFTAIKAIPIPNRPPNTVHKILLVVWTPKMNTSYVVTCSLGLRAWHLASNRPGFRFLLCKFLLV